MMTSKIIGFKHYKTSNTDLFYSKPALTNLLNYKIIIIFLAAYALPVKYSWSILIKQVGLCTVGRLEL